jgi:hypothetical protein
MSRVKVRRRRDGVPQITRDDGEVPADERHFVMATAFFVVGGFFLSGYAPFILVAGLMGAFALGEAIMLVDVFARRRGPPAEVCELVRPSRRRG